MTLNQILNMLDKVSQSGERYKALCPAHDDKRPSLSITEKDNKILLKCWSGCTNEEITSALGIGLKDLFPDSNLSPIERKQYHKQKTRAQYLDLYETESLVLDQFEYSREKGETLSKKDQVREKTAIRRISALKGHINEC